MPLYRMDDLMIAARKNGAALGAFECWDSLNVRGIAMAAARCNSAVIFQATPLEYNLMGGADALADIVKFYVNKYNIAAALHLDHGSTIEHVKECLASGFTSVMLDASVYEFDKNVALSREAAALAAECNASSEAELGHVGGGGDGGANSESVLTVPEETEVEKRPWRFKSIFAVSGGDETVPGGSMVTFDGCFAAAAKHRDFRSFIRKQPAGSSVAVTVSGGVFCSDGSHVSRPGKEVLHGMFGEIFDEYIWGGSAMARKGGSLVINSDIPAASGSVILKNMGRPAAELSFADMEEDFE